MTGKHRLRHILAALEIAIQDSAEDKNRKGASCRCSLVALNVMNDDQSYFRLRERVRAVWCYWLPEQWPGHQRSNSNRLHRPPARPSTSSRQPDGAYRQWWWRKIPV